MFETSKNKTETRVLKRCKKECERIELQRSLFERNFLFFCRTRIDIYPYDT